MATQPPAPSLTVRAYAELLPLPAYEQLRILQEQKYPRQSPQMFRTPFYAPALAAIRAFYSAGNDQAVLDRARATLTRLGLMARRANNARVLDQFERSIQYRRVLGPQPNRRTTAAVGRVRLRLSPDLVALDGATTRYVYYNLRAAPIDAETARTTLEIAGWVLEQNGGSSPFSCVEAV